MQRQHVFVTATVCLTTLGVAHLLAGAGPLDPPPGPVSSTGRTLNELYDAILLGGGGGACVPGSWYGDTAVSIDSGNPFSAYDLSYGFNVVSGLPQLPDNFTITKDVGPETIRLAGDALAGKTIPDVLVSLNDFNANPRFVIRLSAVTVIGFSQTAAIQCDGSYRQLENVTFTFKKISIEDKSTGQTTCWDFVINSSC